MGNRLVPMSMLKLMPTRSYCVVVLQCCGAARHGAASYGAAWRGMVPCGMVQYGMAWYVRYGAASCGAARKKLRYRRSGFRKGLIAASQMVCPLVLCYQRVP